MLKDNYIRCDFCDSVYGVFHSDTGDNDDKVKYFKKFLRFLMQHKPGCPFYNANAQQPGLLDKNLVKLNV
jgi:hypothetical protein